MIPEILLFPRKHFHVTTSFGLEVLATSGCVNFAQTRTLTFFLGMPSPKRSIIISYLETIFIIIITSFLALFRSALGTVCQDGRVLQGAPRKAVGGEGQDDGHGREGDEPVPVGGHQRAGVSGASERMSPCVGGGER